VANQSAGSMRQVKREMGCSLEDLVRWLPSAMGNLFPNTSLESDDSVFMQTEIPLVMISCSVRPARQIALLNVPVLELTLLFSEGLTQIQCDEAIKRFDLYTRRGGG
jgi:hypothetical protein